METLLLKPDSDGIETACRLIKSGEIVGIPTETVYGLGADACNPAAVEKIFRAKGRPADNPLIVHLADFGDAEKYTSYIPELAYKLAEKFCPGPLTMVLPKNEKIPYITSGGLDTVGIRVPSHKVMHEIIEKSGCPISAPSANISGYPSPTSVRHMIHDMDGKISAIVDGGECQFGVESTVISFDSEDTVRILRPGCVTAEMLSEVCRTVIDRAILNEVAEGEKVSSPGMKYKHYSPVAKVTMVECPQGEFRKFAVNNDGEKTYFVVHSEEKENFPCKFLTYGKDSSEQAHRLFAVLRELDEMGAEKVYIEAPEKNGVGLAVYNRLIRACGFEVIRFENS